MKVHLIHKLDERHMDVLNAALDAPVQWSFGKTEVPPDTDILIGGRPGKSLLDASANLKALIIPYAGLPPETRTLLVARPHLKVYNLHHNAPAVAEMSLALMFAAARCLVPMDKSLRAGDWTPRYNPDPGLILAGRRALVLGYGAIGRRVASLCRAVGLEVEAIRRSGPQPGADGVPVHGPQALEACLKRADVLHICVPDTEETRGMLDASHLDLLGTDGVLVNVARAAVVEEKALFEALRDRRIHSAALDVWYTYPTKGRPRDNTMPAEHPFDTLDNVVMSPHRAGHGETVEIARATALARTLSALIQGQKPPHEVQPTLGY